MSLNVPECNAEHNTRSLIYVRGLWFEFYDLEEHNYVTPRGSIWRRQTGEVSISIKSDFKFAMLPYNCMIIRVM
jgi:hypothetical protein